MDALAARIEAGQTLLVVVAGDSDEVVGWVSLDYNDSRLVYHWATVRRLQTHPGAIGVRWHRMDRQFARKVGRT